MAKPAYVGVFLDRSSRKLLLGRVPVRHSTLHADHVTLAFGKALEGKSYPVGKRVVFRIWATAWDLKGQAVLCKRLDLEEFLSGSQWPHITVSCAEGVPPKYSNELMGYPIEALEHEFYIGGTLDYFPRTVPDVQPSLWKRFLLWFDNLGLKWSTYADFEDDEK